MGLIGRISTDQIANLAAYPSTSPKDLVLTSTYTLAWTLVIVTLWPIVVYLNKLYARGLGGMQAFKLLGKTEWFKWGA